MTTTTEENYLKAIYHLSHRPQQSVLTSEIAGILQTTSASVTDMLKKLSDKNLIDYQRYKGVRITRKGEKVALSIIRRHRLWEVFLTEVLKFRWDEVHDMAEELEHVSSDELVKRLDAYLGYPKFDPHGDPIPDTNGKLQAGTKKLFSEILEPGHYVLSGVNDHRAAFLQFLEKKGLLPGTVVEVMEIDPFDRSMQVRFENNNTSFISREVAQHIYIRLYE